MPLSSICRLPSPIGTGSASEPPWWTRSSSIDAQRGARGAADVVGTRLQAVELLDDDQRDHDVDAVERGDARRVGDQDGRVEHDPRSQRPLVALDRHRRCRDRREQIGHRLSLGFWDAAGEVANGVLLYRRRTSGWWMSRASGDRQQRRPLATARCVAGDARDDRLEGRTATVTRRGRLRRSAPSSPGTPTPRSSTATTSPSPSSIARRCSPGTCSSCPTEHVVTLPELADVGPFFERVQRMAAAVPVALGAQGTFVANNNVVSQSVAHLHVHVVPRTKGDGLRGFFWPRSRVRRGGGVGGRGDAFAQTLASRMALTAQLQMQLIDACAIVRATGSICAALTRVGDRRDDSRRHITGHALGTTTWKRINGNQGRAHRRSGERRPACRRLTPSARSVRSSIT